MIDTRVESFVIRSVVEYFVLLITLLIDFIEIIAIKNKLYRFYSRSKYIFLFYLVTNKKKKKSFYTIYIHLELIRIKDFHKLFN